MLLSTSPALVVNQFFFYSMYSRYHWLLEVNFFSFLLQVLFARFLHLLSIILETVVLTIIYL